MTTETAKLTGTMRTTENGAHTWSKGITLAQAAARFAQLGDVKQKGNIFTVTRWCGGKFKAEFFPSK
jgi:hypothetical protein